MYRTLILAILICSLLLGCSNPQKLLESNNPERAYTVSKRLVDQRLKRDKPFKNDELHILAASYGQLQDELIREIEALELGRMPGRWLELYPLYQKLLERRQDIEPYLPLLNGFDPRYGLATLQALTERSRQQAGAYCYAEAEAIFPAARAGDKSAARRAYHWLAKGLGYAPERADYLARQAEMAQLGILRVQVSLAAPRGYYADHLADYFLRGREMERFKWMEVYFSPSRIPPDYIVQIELDHAYVSFDQEQSHTASFCQDVVDGYKTVEKEVWVNDSTKVIVKEEVPIIVTVSGAITTVEQSKSASASFYATLMPAEGGLAEHSWQRSEYAEWRHSYEICSGDSRALPRSCWGFRQMFPSDWAMLRDLAPCLRQRLLTDLRALFPEAAGRYINAPGDGRRRG